MVDCPHCGQTIPDRTFPDVKLTRMEKRMYARIKRAGQCGVPRDALADYMWGDDPDGGPLNPFHVISVYLTHINHKIVPIGQRIIYTGSHGEYVLAKATSKNFRRNLTAQEKQEIRAIKGKLQREIAVQYGVTAACISQVRRGL